MAILPKSALLSDVQTATVREMITQRFLAGDIATQAEYDTLLRNTLAKIKTNGVALFKARKQSGQTDYYNFNESFSELEFDLASLFSYMGKVQDSLTRNQQLNHSVINNLKLRVKKLQDKMTQFERMVQIRSSEQIYLETFVDGNSMDTDPDYFQNEHSVEMPLTYLTKLDTELEAIKLPTVLSENTLIGANGVRLGRVSIRKQLGSDLVHLVNPTNGPDNMIDDDMDTYWTESVLIDAPLQVQMDAEYYNLDFGALVEIEVEFDYLTQINEIGMTIFGEYPLDVVAVKYSDKDGGEEEDTFTELISPNQPTLTSRVVKRSTSYQFPDIYVKRMRILFNQRHYVKTDFTVSKQDQDHLEIWFHTRKGIEQSTDTNLFQPIIDDRTELMPTWDLFTKAIDDPNIDIDKLMAQTTDTSYRVVNKYEYDYGLYNLALRKNEYQPTGVYVSKPIPIQGNARTFKLETLEEHPTVLNDLAFTDIEYYVYNGRNWNPILPMNQERVRSELLQPVLTNGKYVAITRFPMEGDDWEVRKNGILANNLITLGDDKRTITFKLYDASAPYTVSYTTGDKARYLDFVAQFQDENGDVIPEYAIEEFRGTNASNVVTLSAYPYVDRRKLNQQPVDYKPSYLKNDFIPIRVKFIDENGYHIEQPTDEMDTDIRVENVTDYASSSINLLKPYNAGAGVYYQYRVVGNQLIFNTRIPATTRIIVEYPWLVTNVRLKAIMRRNLQGPGFNGLTPILHEYVVHFQTLT